MDNYYNINGPTPVEERIKNAYMSKNGLYPHEIILIKTVARFVYGRTINNNHWWYTYGIRDVQAIIDSLFERGFICLGGLAETINMRTVSDMKTLLKENGLTVGGKKADLISRILKNIPQNKIEKAFPERYYKLTDLGKKEIEDNDYLFEVLSNYYGIDIWEANRILFQGDSKSFYELMFKQFENKMKKYADSEDYENLINTLKWRIQLSNYHNKFDNILSDLAKVIYLEINGAQRTQKEYVKYSLSYIFPYASKSCYLKLNENTKKWLINLKSIVGVTNEDIKNSIIVSNEELSLKLEIFTKQECGEIAILEINKENESLEKLYNEVEERLYTEHPKFKSQDENTLNNQVAMLTNEEIKEMEFKDKMKSTKEKMLLDSFNILKNDVEVNHEQLKKILSQLQEIHPDLAVELWKYLLEENWNKVVKEKEMYNSVAYYLTNEIINELTDSNAFEQTEKYFLKETKILEAVYKYSPELDIYITGIIGIHVRNKEFDIANKMFELMFSNNKNNFLETNSYCSNSYSGIFKNIIEDYILTNKTFVGQRAYCYQTNTDEEIFEFIKYWADQISDNTEKARVNVFLTELI